MAMSEHTKAAITKKNGGVWGNLQKYCHKGARLHVPILEKIQTTTNTYRYVLGLPDADLPLGIRTGFHIYIHAKVATKKKPKGEEIKRIYCIASPEDRLGSFDLRFKVYRKGTHSNYPEGGVMSQYLESLNVGDKITISGPLIGFWYPGPGHFQINFIATMTFKNLGMICGGTGITAMYPVIRAIINNPADKTNATFLFANNGEADILMREELQQLPSDPRVKIYYTLTQPTVGWTGYEGRVTKEMIAKTMPAPSNDTFMWVCGPEPMDKAVEKTLFDMKYKKNKLMISSDLSYFAYHILRSMCCCGSK